MDLLRHGGMDRLLTGIRAPSTLGTFLRTFTFGHVRRSTPSPPGSCPRWPRTPRSCPAPDQSVYVDIDDTIKATHGYAKQGAGYGYTNDDRDAFGANLAVRRTILCGHRKARRWARSREVCLPGDLVCLDRRMIETTVDQARAAEALFTAVERAHRAEDVDAYILFFHADAVWVTGRGVCYRGRDRLAEYLRSAIPGGLGEGSVKYLVESVHPINPDQAVVVVDQTYTNAEGDTRDARARHTHSYMVSFAAAQPCILAGQNTVRVAD